MEFLGLPLHAFIVHVPVVVVPVAVLSALVFAFVRRWRYLTRWPTAVLALVTLVSVWVSRLSGQSYVDANPGLADIVQVHSERGEILSLVSIAFALVVAVAVWALGGDTGLKNGRSWPSRSRALDRALPVVVLVVAALELVYVMLTGDAGARAVWS